MPTEAFILHHQMNAIQNEIQKLLVAIKQGSDKRVLEGVQYSAEAAIRGMFPLLTEEDKDVLFSIKTIQSAEDCEAYLQRLAPYAAAFPSLTEKQVQKLFPKVKKLKVPELTALDYRGITYLSWTDAGANKLFLVYPWNGTLTGVECRYTVSSKATVCALCNAHRAPGEIGLVTAICKNGRHVSPDYYKSIGNYMCLDGAACNTRIRDVTYLETFLDEVLSQKQ